LKKKKKKKREEEEEEEEEEVDVVTQNLTLIKCTEFHAL
jgi:hypothetical protein